MNTNPDITATARDAGRNVVHTVAYKGDVVGTRRSAHRYPYAICEWITEYDLVDGHWVKRRRPDGTVVRRVLVKRWSRSPKCSGADFAVPVRDA